MNRRCLAGCVDAQEMHRNHRDTLSAPSNDELLDIKPGDCIKVSRNGERFWILVTSHEGDRIGGTIENKLFFSSLGVGSPIAVRERHVFDIHKKEDAAQ